MQLAFSQNRIMTRLTEIGDAFGLKAIAPFLPDRFKYGRIFNETYTFLKKSQYMPHVWLKKYQTFRMRTLVHYAFERSRYYRHLFKALDIVPSQIRGLDDLSRIPVLTKLDIQENINDLIVTDYPRHRVQHLTTGGSTGVATILYQDRVITNEREWAFIRTMWDRIGYKEKSKMIVLRGHHLDDDRHPGHYYYNWGTRSLILSSFHMDRQTLSRYTRLISRFCPAYYHAYPSSMAILLRHAIQAGVDLPPTSGVLLGSEKTPSELRGLIQKVLCCRPFTYYGQSERVVEGGECEVSNHYHIFPEYGICEILGRDNEPIYHPREMGKVVGTGFNNPVMPLIRFDTEDLTSWLDLECECGRAYPLIDQIEGRVSNAFVISQDGRPVSTTALSIGFFDKLRMFQFMQREPGEVVLRLVPGPRFRDGDERVFQDYFIERLGKGFSVSVDIVEDIEPSPSGKRSMLNQYLSIEDYL